MNTSATRTPEIITSSQLETGVYHSYEGVWSVARNKHGYLNAAEAHQKATADGVAFKIKKEDLLPIQYLRSWVPDSKNKENPFLIYGILHFI